MELTCSAPARVSATVVACTSRKSNGDFRAIPLAADLMDPQEVLRKAHLLIHAFGQEERRLGLYAHAVTTKGRPLFIGDFMHLGLGEDPGSHQKGIHVVS